MVFLLQLSLLLVATSASLPTVLADGQYRSRPDLSPPKLNITVVAPNANGTEYVFLSPYAGELQQPGAYIYRKNGDLVWSGIGYYAGFVGNFHPTTYKGETVLQAFQGTIDFTHGEGWGQQVLLNQNYEHVATAKAANHRIPSIHEFNVIDGKTALVEVYTPTPWNLSAYGGNTSQQWIGDGYFQEFDIATGELIFEWNALDHIDPAESLITLASSTANTALTASTSWDFIHINSVDKDREGNYLVSSRHLSTIFKINGTDGRIIWRLGGSNSTFTFPTDPTFAFGFQHHARWHPHPSESNKEVISFFDNSNSGAGIIFNNVSRALLVELDSARSTATVLRKATAPYGISAVSQGNAQLLANGRVFVNWGSAGAISEFEANDRLVFHAWIEDGVSYRGFVGNWTGTPKEEPAVVAYTFGERVRVYVSWNGDTETAAWRFYGVRQGEARNVLLGVVQRKSFETVLLTSPGQGGGLSGYYVVAIDKQGAVLGRSRAVRASEWVALG
ncbi:arylsulfotransferase family protein [Aspergillus homomorphus CBS 101889]|uniref:Arylsulfotransferase n=1 Tax=Aspergillus homomorphus (strain CBS 101889) TaxID=1450537 RepID=A0A395HSL7_ASPHC|nr:arylsulfotransferase [Aspergillus homomorphus CBS 101889]RAL10941.1 arylsulfotransferase [Aspergillus homomorphus CBS 101889]